MISRGKYELHHASEWKNHAYTSKKPNGRGGWIYYYGDEPGRVGAKPITPASSVSSAVINNFRAREAGNRHHEAVYKNASGYDLNSRERSIAAGKERNKSSNNPYIDGHRRRATIANNRANRTKGIMRGGYSWYVGKQALDSAQNQPMKFGKQNWFGRTFDHDYSKIGNRSQAERDYETSARARDERNKYLENKSEKALADTRRRIRGREHIKAVYNNTAGYDADARERSIAEGKARKARSAGNRHQTASGYDADARENYMAKVKARKAQWAGNRHQESASKFNSKSDLDAREKSIAAGKQREYDNQSAFERKKKGNNTYSRSGGSGRRIHKYK